MMIRAVLDTNIWLASIEWRGRGYKIRQYAEEYKFTPVCSLSILAELTRVLRRDFGYSDDDAYYWHNHIGSLCDLVSPESLLNVVPDNSTDNKFIECAVEGEVEYIVSRDRHLLRIGEYEGIKIIDDKEFIAIIEAEQ